MTKKVAFKVGVISLELGILTFFGCQQRQDLIEKPSQIIEVEQDCKEEYQRGVNAALQSIMLHDLELSLNAERMTWGERANIVRRRLFLKR